jgi:NADPH:quinone reductase-like Zn-dependent oxidoreductase
LIHAGAGGVGSTAIQLTKALGARVLTTCSSQNADLAQSLGADVVIDYKSLDYEKVVLEKTGGTGVNLVLDTIGGNTLERGPYMSKHSGRNVTIVDIPKPQSLLEAWGRNITIHFIFVAPRRDKLDTRRDMIDRGQIKPVVDSVMPLSQVAQTHRLLE